MRRWLRLRVDSVRRSIPAVAAAASVLAISAASARAQRVFFDDSVHALVPPGNHGYSLVGTEVPAAFGDFDGDGDLDLVQARSLLINDGNGAYHALRNPMPSLYAYETVFAWASADVNGDGFVDLVSTGIENDAIYLGDGTAHFVQLTSVPRVPGHDWGRDVELADIDGDGDLDVLFAYRVQINGAWHAGGVLLWRNDGNGSFVDASQQIASSPLDDPIAIALGDFDGDGDPDLLVVNTQQGGGLPNHHRLLLNDGSGTFSDASNLLPPISSNAWRVSATAADLDSDGDLDVLIGGATLLRNVGSATFVDASAALPLSPPSSSNWADVGDVDGDNDLDIVAVDPLNRVLLQQPGGSFTPAPTTPASRARLTRVLLADVDGDGDLDAHGTVYAGRAELLLNDGTGRFTETSPDPLGTSAYTGAIAHGDVDGDGDIDVYAASAPHQLWLNDGVGGLVDASAQLPGGPGYGSHVELADLDGDQDLDLLVAHASSIQPGGALPSLLTNDGSGVFSDSIAQWSSPPNFVDTLATADIDGDGDRDVLTASYGHPTQLFVNNGAGYLSPSPTPWPPTGAGLYSIAFGDLDGDGDPDAITGGAVFSLCINNGAGAFQAASNSGLPAGSFLFLDVRLADFDADGDLDLAAEMEGPGASGLRVFLNDGSAHFTAGAQLPIAPRYAIGDIDGDGDLDLWFSGGAFHLFLNDGQAAFTDATSGVRIATTETEALDLADLDSDGDLDGVVASLLGATFVVPNLARHVHWRTLPRIGYPLELEVRGEPNTGFQLFGSLATAQVPLGAVGTLRIDRSQIVQRVHGTLDADGRGLVTRQIPANPALVGRSIYWQALDTHPRKLTNLETTTIVNL